MADGRVVASIVSVAVWVVVGCCALCAGPDEHVRAAGAVAFQPVGIMVL